VQAPEVWVTHGRDDALIHALSLRGVRGRALHLIGREEDDDAPEAAPVEEGAAETAPTETTPTEAAPLPAGGGFGADVPSGDAAR
jgi:putative mRNA 3-end processing factor